MPDLKRLDSVTIENPEYYIGVISKQKDKIQKLKQLVGLLEIEVQRAMEDSLNEIRWLKAVVREIRNGCVIKPKPGLPNECVWCGESESETYAQYSNISHRDTCIVQELERFMGTRSGNPFQDVIDNNMAARASVEEWMEGVRNNSTPIKE